MMKNNAVSHSGSFTHQGVLGRTYYATIVYQAGKNGDWDNRSLSSPTTMAQP
jgi:hypothetical protein